MGKFLIKNRKYIHAIFAIVLYSILSYFEVGLLWLFLGTIVLGVVFGKVFCKWMCPVGVFMGLFTKKTMDEQQRMMYKHKKVGCPIAWVTGYLNRLSLYKIKVNNDTCVSCGTCDDSCYITKVDKNYSLYKSKKLSPNDHYNCAKCLSCIEDCPTDSIKLELS